MERQPRVLIVEDEIFIAMSLQMELQAAGYSVNQPVSTGEAAISIVQQDKPDVVLMDISLAGEIDGIEAAQRIRAVADVPVIFMTGYPDCAVEEQTERLNPLGYFIKPVKVSAIKALINAMQDKP